MHAHILYIYEPLENSNCMHLVESRCTLTKHWLNLSTLETYSVMSGILMLNLASISHSKFVVVTNLTSGHSVSFWYISP